MAEQYFADLLKNREDTLEHHGILGQKWGIRRYQNIDGSLTQLGKQRVSEGIEGVRKTLEEGKNEVTRRKFFGDLKSAAGAVGTIAGSTAAGAGIGALTGGPAGAVVGGYAGYMAGMVPAGIAGYFIQKHANAKADALDEQCVLLGHKMMAEVEKTKMSDVDEFREELSAKEAAKKAGLDQGDNWKMYRDAQRGDENAKATVAEWEKEHKKRRDQQTRPTDENSTSYTTPTMGI